MNYKVQKMKRMKKIKNQIVFLISSWKIKVYYQNNQKKKLKKKEKNQKIVKNKLNICRKKQVLKVKNLKNY